MPVASGLCSSTRCQPIRRAYVRLSGGGYGHRKVEARDVLEAAMAPEATEAVGRLAGRRTVGRPPTATLVMARYAGEAAWRQLSPV